MIYVFYFFEVYEVDVFCVKIGLRKIKVMVKVSRFELFL